MKDIHIRAYRPDDLAGIKQLTVEAFAGVTLEQNVETALGVLHGRNWRWRKARLKREGRSAAEAKRLIAGVVAAEMFGIAKHKQPFDEARFVQRLLQLPDMSWSGDVDA